MMSATDDSLHGKLAGWIARHGGEVHRSLALHTPAGAEETGGGEDSPNKFSHRGIFANHGPIKEGEVLVRLPRRLALDGSRLPSSYASSGNDAREVKCAIW